MQYLIDSDAVSALTRGDGDIQKYFSSLGENAVISLCILTVYEFEFSISACADLGTKSRIEQSLKSLKTHFSIVGLGFEDAKIYGNLKAKFREKTGIDQKTLKRHNLDIALASVAIANNCVVVSRDEIFKNHLQKMDNRLRCESW
jgi:predicted nucleic acid-binding protein